ncbi:unnamed protein product [Citrullus colocynthis]|uniref:Uncharacterized protein n=1 Tax=Citrullus colocynthis TaxID=252529 RepID=A0ABP0YNG2_9ROSI
MSHLSIIPFFILPFVLLRVFKNLHGSKKLYPIIRASPFFFSLIFFVHGSSISTRAFTFTKGSPSCVRASPWFEPTAFVVRASLFFFVHGSSSISMGFAANLDADLASYWTNDDKRL